jgi:hypothetical protein
LSGHSFAVGNDLLQWEVNVYERIQAFCFIFPYTGNKFFIGG